MVKNLNVVGLRLGDRVTVKANTKTYQYLKSRHRLSRTGYTVLNVDRNEKTVQVLISENERRTFPVNSFTSI